MPTPTPPAERRLEELSHDECVKRLSVKRLGRIGFLHEGNVEIRPVNYRFHEGTVVLRTAYETVLDRLTARASYSRSTRPRIVRGPAGA